MMKSFILMALVLMLNACTMIQSNAGMALFMQVRDTNLVTSNDAYKVGESCATNILGIYAYGDMSVETAKKDGGIIQVATVDKTIRNYLFFGTVCTIVRGR